MITQFVDSRNSSQKDFILLKKIIFELWWIALFFFKAIYFAHSHLFLLWFLRKQAYFKFIFIEFEPKYFWLHLLVITLLNKRILKTQIETKNIIFFKAFSFSRTDLKTFPNNMYPLWNRFYFGPIFIIIFINFLRDDLRPLRRASRLRVGQTGRVLQDHLLDRFGHLHLGPVSVADHLADQAILLCASRPRLRETQPHRHETPGREAGRECSLQVISVLDWGVFRKQYDSYLAGEVIGCHQWEGGVSVF